MPKINNSGQAERHKINHGYRVSNYIDRFFAILTSQELYLFVISVSLAATLLVTFFQYSSQSFDLLHFYHRAIGGAVMEAQDSALRSKLFYVLLMLAGFTFATIFSSAITLLHLLSRQNLLFKTRVERTVISHSSLLIIPCLIMTALHAKNNFSINILVGITISSLLIIFSKIIVSFFYSVNSSRSLCKYKLFISLLFAFSSSYFGFTVLSGGKPFLVGNHSVLLVAASLIVIYNIKKIGLKEKNIIQACFPLTLIPLSLPVSCEIQYWITKYFIVNLNIIYATLTAFLIFFSFYLYKIRSIKISSHNIINTFLFPIFLATLIVFYYWKAEFTFTIGPDLLHPGNFLVPAQMFIGHGLLPFVEFWPDLGLQAALPASLYTFIFGTHGLDGLIYHFIPRLISGIALYFLLCRFFTAQWSLMCSVFLPLAISPEWIANSPRFYFPDRVSFALVPILCVAWVMKSFTTKRLIVLWMIALMSFAWMPSTGKTVVQCFFVLLLLYSLQKPGKNLKSITIAFATVFVPTFSLYFLLLFIYGFNPIDSVQSVLAYNIAEKYVLSYPEIVHGGISDVALWYYGIRPLLLFAIIGIIFYRQIRRCQITPNQWILTALSIFTLFAGVRALNRHCLIETYDPVFFIILAALIPFLFYRNPRWCITWATIVFSLAALFMPRYPGLSDSLQTTPKQWSSNRPDRVIINDKDNQALALVRFLKQHLGKDQTYLEFIHAHLLYVLSGHVMPPFQKIARVLSSERAQQVYLKQAKKEFRENKIPLVIIDGPFWGSRVDNIASSMALFRISEFINKNYSPFAEVNGFVILKANNSDITFTPQNEKDIPLVRFHEKQIFQTIQSVYDVKKDLLILISGNSDPQISNLLAYTSHSVILNTKKSTFLKLRLQSNIDGQLQAYYAINDTAYSEKMSSTVKLEASRGIKDYLIPIPDSKNSAHKLTNLRLDPPDNSKISIESIDIVEYNQPVVIAKRLSKISQNFDMRKLPYVWANFDKDNKWQSGGLLFTNKEERTLEPQQEEIFFIPAGINKAEGNYISFRIRSQHGGKVRLTYGSDSQNSVSFDLKNSKKAEEYVVRISSQWAWMEEDIRKIVFACDSNATVQSFSIWKAD